MPYPKRTCKKKPLQWKDLNIQRIKSTTDIAKKQHQKVDDTYEFNKTIEREKPAIKRHNRSNLIYSRKHSFYENYNINFSSLSLISKYKVLISFYDELMIFIV